MDSEYYFANAAGKNTMILMEIFDGCLPERQLPRPTCFIQSTLATRFLVGNGTLENNISEIDLATQLLQKKKQPVVASFSDVFDQGKKEIQKLWKFISIAVGG